MDGTQSAFSCFGASACAYELEPPASLMEMYMTHLLLRFSRFDFIVLPPDQEYAEGLEGCMEDRGRSAENCGTAIPYCWRFRVGV